MLRAKENFGASQRTCCENDNIGADKLSGRIEFSPTGTNYLKVHQPFPTLLFDIADTDFGKNIGTVIPGVGQIVHLHRVFGGVVATRDTVPAQDTGRLLDPDMIDVIFVFIKCHSDRRPVKLFLHEFTGLFMCR